jgi:SAM-dependent methyltransferase
MKCRHCDNDLMLPLIDLGFAPPSNAYLTEQDLNKPEVTYPLRVLTCTSCWLVQTEDYANSEMLFDENYAYFSSTSTSWLDHAERYCSMIIEKLGLNGDSFVVELASNDGYLLRNFLSADIPCLGIEPTASTAAAARSLGIDVRQEFFGRAMGLKLAKDGQAADLIIGNNVYAHVPDINDFTKGIAALLKPDGVVTLEFPHLLQLLKHTQFDTIYHEHYSYLSLIAVESILNAAGLRVFDVELLMTHGGSLRIYGCLENAIHPPSEAVGLLKAEEIASGLQNESIYRSFQPKADAVKNGLLNFLLEVKKQGKTIAGYGAAAKGNTLLNYAGIKPDLLPFVCDAAPSKIGKFLPGSHIPVRGPEELARCRPDYVLILPWNIAEEVVDQNADLLQTGTQFVTGVPELKVIPV